MLFWAPECSCKVTTVEHHQAGSLCQAWADGTSTKPIIVCRILCVLVSTDETVSASCVTAVGRVALANQPHEHTICII